MKKLLFLALLLAAALPTFAQSSYNFQRRSLFEVLPIHSNDIVFLGNSITDGCEWAELDVQMTSDGVVVVTHDSNLKRCTGKNAKVYDLTYAEVAQLDAGRWFSSRFADTRIPTLEQVLQLCRGHGLPLAGQLCAVPL